MLGTMQLNNQSNTDFLDADIAAAASKTNNQQQAPFIEKKKIKLLPTYDNPLPHSNLKSHRSNESLSPTGTKKVQTMRQKLNIEGIDSLNMSWDSGMAPGNKDPTAKSNNAMGVTQHAKLTKMVN